MCRLICAFVVCIWQNRYFNTDRSKAVLLLWFFTVTCSCCPYLYFGSPVIWVTYLKSWMTTCLGKSCSFGLPHIFVNSCQFKYLVISLLFLRAGCGIWLYQFLIFAYLFTFLMTWLINSHCYDRQTHSSSIISLHTWFMWNYYYISNIDHLY